MNICKEKERLEILKNNAHIKYRQAIPIAVFPLKQNTPKTQAPEGSIKQRTLEQEYKVANEKYELHKKGCSICVS